MLLKIGFTGLLVISFTAAAELDHQNISQQAIRHIEQAIGLNTIRQDCSSYQYKIFAGKIKNQNSHFNIAKIKVNKKSETVDWIVTDSIGNKVDLRIYAFQTHNGKVSSDVELIHQSEDWGHYLKQCGES